MWTFWLGGARKEIIAYKENKGVWIPNYQEMANMTKTRVALEIHPKARAPHQPCTLIIFGVTGDLAARKLLPALYNLRCEGLLPTQFHCIGVARRPKSETEIRTDLRAAVAEFSRTQPLNEEILREFETSITYQMISFEEDAGYIQLKEQLEQLELKQGLVGNRVFYLSTAPSFFPVIVEKLKSHNLVYDTKDKVAPWSRVIIEKPFGRDLDSALALQAHVDHYLDESQVFRIDHYLGKETVQNLMVFRFGNHIFESLWNNQHIDNVQITMSEDLGIGRRGSFYEEAGQLRDIVQNHMMQLLSLLAMEPPASLKADAVRNEKIKVLESIRPFPIDAIDQFAVRGQYSPGLIDGQAVASYREEHNVNSQSEVETFLALKLFIDNWRWSGVPFYLRTGKRLARRTTEIVVVFKTVPSALFQSDDPQTNHLRIRIQPDEGIALSLNCKIPGMTGAVQPVTMNFCYSDYFNAAPPEAYERLLCDCFLGDTTLFARKDEVAQSWRLLTPVLQHWERAPADDFPNYPAGTWGPVSSDILLARAGHQWCKPDRK